MECFKKKHTSPILVIIADDLTGALDTGIKFAMRGARTITVTVSSSQDLISHLQGGYEVVSVNASSRHMPGPQAAELVSDLVSACISEGVRYIYKKTDSVLRGNIACELEGVRKASGVSFIPFIPSYPEMKRTVEEGTMYVGGVPLAQTELADDPFSPIISSRPRDVFTSSRLNVADALAPGSLPPEGIDLAIYDGRSQEDLVLTARILLDHGQKVFAGCAGFAQALACQLFVGKCPQMEYDTTPMLVLCGSVNKVSKDQMEYMEALGSPRLRFAQAALTDSSWIENEGEDAVSEIQRFFNDGCDCVLVDTLADAASVRGQDFSAAAMVAHSLGSLAARCLSHADFSLLVIGGDTLLSFLEELGSVEIEPRVEIGKGMVLSLVHMEDGRTMTLMSKSGGFGSKDLVATLVKNRNTNRR